MKKILSGAGAFALFCSLSAATYYVDNVKGNDSNDGSKERPVASIEKGLSLLKKSDRLEVAPNNGKPYRRPYPGTYGKSYEVLHGGTADNPMVINGNGAVISGLSEIPLKTWKKTDDGLYKMPFWPMSNMYRIYKQQDYWLPDAKIFFVNGERTTNCLSMAELKKTPNAFWWSRKEKSLYYNPPAGKTVADVKIELPSNSGFYVMADHTRVENFTMILSFNDGFDTNRHPRNVIFRNCAAIDNCGQAFSCHDTGVVYYEDCVAVRCASSGACDVHSSNSNYVRCVFIDNVFECGVFGANFSAHTYADCLIAGNKPFEQIWQHQMSRMFFHNCVISGLGNSKALAFYRNGSLSFLQCTLVNGGKLFSGNPDNRGSIQVENCVLAHMKDVLFEVPAGKEKQLRFAGNVYCGKKGIRKNGKLLPPGTSAGKFETDCVWSSEVPAGRLNAEIKNYKRLKGAGGVVRSCGAKLPESVWANYRKYRRARTSVNGLHFVSE